MHLFQARQTETEYIFEVCDDAAGECSHGPQSPVHRSYTWGRESGDMTPEDMVREIEALERGRQARVPRSLIHAERLPEEGRDLSV